MSKTISPNTTIAQYTIVSKIGEGGMGEVWRARDSKLGRDVAIKVLPASLSENEDRLRRFEQEAQAAGALNHPNILVIYHIGTHEGAPYIVSELLEGEELRDRLDEASIPLRKTIEYALQIVSGLSAAHEKGIVHRDLKPENLFITKDDRAKILDFGIAKLSASGTVETGSEDATRKVLTNPGVVMGTVGYMSPEQVRGQPVDHRSDIFSFGAILHEMITGRRAFRRETMAETMTAILKEEPEELTESNPNINPSLERIVRRCLEKKPERRFQSTADLGFALESLSAPTSSSGSGLTTAATAAIEETRRSAWRGRLPWMVSGVLLLGLVASLPFAIQYFRQPRLAEPAATSFFIAPPEKSSGFNQLSISPDGRNIVYITTLDGKSQLWLRPLGSLSARPVAGTDSANGFMFWSPDNRSIAFQTPGKVKKVDLADGTVQTICDTISDIRGFDGTWARDGTILFFNGGTGILRIAPGGGQPTVLPGYEPSSERIDRWPKFLPDGRHFLFLSTNTEQAKSEIFIGSAESSERKRIMPADSNAMYVPAPAGDGYVVFARDGALFAQAFDAKALAVTGEPFRIAEQIRVNLNSRAYFSLSENGTLIYDPYNDGEKRQLAWFDRTGKQIGTIGQDGPNLRVWLSPDQRYAAVTRRAESGLLNDLFVLDIARGASSRLNFGDPDTTQAIWSPDGSRVAWSMRRGAVWQLIQKLASGAGQEEVLLESKDRFYPTDWSPDGKFIIYTHQDVVSKRDIRVLPLEGDRKPFVYFQTPQEDSSASFSPDGKFVAYHSSESGRDEVYVQTFPASASKWPVSTNGGSNPRWRPDGKELFYIQTDGKVMSVEIKSGSSFEPGIPKPLFDISAARTQRSLDYAVSRDGQRLLFLSRLTETGLSPLAVVVNWTANFKR